MSFSLSDDVSGLVNPDGNSPNEGAVKLLVGDGSGGYTDSDEYTLTGSNIGTEVPSGSPSNLKIGSGSTGPNFGLEFDIPDGVDTSVSFSPELTIRASST